MAVTLTLITSCAVADVRNVLVHLEMFGVCLDTETVVLLCVVLTNTKEGLLGPFINMEFPTLHIICSQVTLFAT